MTYFSRQFFVFFEALRVNNNTEWFRSNKSVYEKDVKIPFERFIQDLIDEMRKFDLGVPLHANEAILRINRDIRFSKDKSPYNLNRTALISAGGKRDKSYPGIYLRFSTESAGIMGGCYGPDTSQIGRIRNYIAKHPKRFEDLVTDPEFVEKFGAVRGEAVKRIPANLADAAARTPLILNKQWYFVAEREPELLLSENLLEVVMDHYRRSRKFNDFLIEAMK